MNGEQNKPAVQGNGHGGARLGRSSFSRVSLRAVSWRMIHAMGRRAFQISPAQFWEVSLSHCTASFPVVLFLPCK